jgi:hypothetical protein
MEYHRNQGLLGDAAEMLYAFDAATHEEAQAVHHLRMGWEPYKPVGDPANCLACGARYYPDGSGQCWRCITACHTA